MACKAETVAGRPVCANARSSTPSGPPRQRERNSRGLRRPLHAVLSEIRHALAQLKANAISSPPQGPPKIISPYFLERLLGSFRNYPFPWVACVS
jgi:hypothetical protein